MSALGYPTSGSLPVTCLQFANDGVNQIGPPVLGTNPVSYSNNMLTVTTPQDDDQSAYAFEF